jgi:methylamine dehydrogenase accessory protein MauD
MMSEALTVAVVMLSVIVVGLVAAVFALARQVGILYERIAPVGALTMDAGPKVGELAPHFELVGLAGERIEIGRPGAFSTLLFFLSPTCPVCKKLLPILKSTAKSEHSWLRIVFASDGEPVAQARFRESAKLEMFPYALSTDLGLAFKVSRLPHAVLIDEHGRVRSKGLVNSREQIESLFNAKELGVGTVQEYLGTSRPAANSEESNHAVVG